MRSIYGPREDGLAHFSSDVGEVEAATVAGVGEFFVIAAELVEDGGMGIVNVCFADGSVIADFAGLAGGPVVVPFDVIVTVTASLLFHFARVKLLKATTTLDHAAYFISGTGRCWGAGSL